MSVLVTFVVRLQDNCYELFATRGELLEYTDIFFWHDARPCFSELLMARIISRCASEFSFASVVVLSRKENIEGVFLYSFLGVTNWRTLLSL